MKVMVVGSGGREHALVWKLAQSPRVRSLYCAPGNAGIAALAECVPIQAEDVAGLLDFARAQKIDLTVVGPEAPLTAGIVDEFGNAGLRIFGPSRTAAELEGSKVFCKLLLQKYGIPTGSFAVFEDPMDAMDFVQERGAPLVIKADGLAAGKGVFVAMTMEECMSAIDRIMVDREFGAAGDRVIIEECLTGEEASLMAFVDGKHISPMVPAQDHKRALDNDQGPNTGGMGAYSPVPAVTEEIYNASLTQILQPTIDAMAQEGRPYKGVLYAGLMLTSEGPKVLEFNCRFGDPETQVIIPRLRSDLIEILEACIDERLDEVQPVWTSETCVCVVIASGGYPGKYEKGKIVHGLTEALRRGPVMVFHAGTEEKDGRIVTSGGRVLAVTALGDGYQDAVERVYQAVDRIHFDGAHCRRDIARKALQSATG